MSNSNTIYIPYTYLIGWSKLDKWYYGVEYGIKSKIANPQNLWTVYFTSSKYVEAMRTEYGEPDVIQIRRTFKTANEALSWEYRVLNKIGAANSQKWLNETNGGSTPHSEKTIELIRDKASNRYTYNDGITEIKLKIGIPAPEGYTRGKLSPTIPSENHKKSLSISKKRYWDSLEGIEKKKNMKHSKETREKCKIVQNNLVDINNGIKDSKIIVTSKLPEGWKYGKLKKLWYNNGEKEYLYIEGTQPPGWLPNRLRGIKGWYNNGYDEKKISHDFIPDGWVPGRVPGKINKNRKGIKLSRRGLKSHCD